MGSVQADKTRGCVIRIRRLLRSQFRLIANTPAVSMPRGVSASTTVIIALIDRLKVFKAGGGSAATVVAGM
jgi:hypothetical protein